MWDSGGGPCAQLNGKSIVCILVAALISGPVKWTVYDEWRLRVLKRGGDTDGGLTVLSAERRSARSQVYSLRERQTGRYSQG